MVRVPTARRGKQDAAMMRLVLHAVQRGMVAHIAARDGLAALRPSDTDPLAPLREALARVIMAAGQLEHWRKMGLTSTTDALQDIVEQRWREELPAAESAIALIRAWALQPTQIQRFAEALFREWRADDDWASVPEDARCYWLGGSEASIKQLLPEVANG